MYFGYSVLFSLQKGVYSKHEQVTIFSFNMDIIQKESCHDLFPIGWPCVRDDWTGERANGQKYEIIINSRTESEEGVVYLQLFVKSVQASHSIDLLRFL